MSWLITENRRQIEYAIEDLYYLRKIEWIFASSAKKQKAVDAYEFWILIEMETMVKESGNKGQYLKTQSGSTE